MTRQPIYVVTPEPVFCVRDPRRAAALTAWLTVQKAVFLSFPHESGGTAFSIAHPSALPPGSPRRRRGAFALQARALVVIAAAVVVAVLVGLAVVAIP